MFKSKILGVSIDIKMLEKYEEVALEMFGKPFYCLNEALQQQIKSNII